MDDLRAARIALNESEARDHNERSTEDGRREGADAPSPLTVTCECGDAGCQAAIEVSLAEYEAVRAHPARFLVTPGHEIAGAETVVGSRPRFRVVEKIGAAREIAEHRDPRERVKTCRVLVVDDVVEVRILIKMLLQLEPTVTVVAEAGNGEEAVAAAREADPDVVILDLEMPVMDGFTALPEIADAAPGVKIIVFSGTGAQDERALLDRGAFRVIPKGGDPGVLVDAVREIAAQRGSRP